MMGALIGIAVIWAVLGALVLLYWLGSEYPGVLVCILITAVGAFMGWSIHMGWHAG